MESERFMTDIEKKNNGVPSSFKPGVATPSVHVRCRLGGWGKSLPGEPMDGFGLLDYARDAGLSAVMFGTTAHFPSGDDADLARVRDYAERLGITTEYGTGGTDPDRLEEALRISRGLGARVLRIVVGGAKLGGDRRGWEGRWQGFLHQVRDSFRSVLPLAERWGIVIAVENHQDLCTEEILWLAEELNSPRFGVTLDVANPLATAEHPLEQTEALAHLVRSVHVKDYRLIESDEGYRLARCAVGDGTTPLAEILEILKRHRADLCLHVELAAWEARHVRCLAPDFWHEYPPRDAAQLARVLRFVRDRAADSRADWRTPWERRESEEALAAYEEGQLARSVSHLKAILSRPEFAGNRGSGR
jgi:sugar phosphate isomerase/epimerase